MMIWGGVDGEGRRGRAPADRRGSRPAGVDGVRGWLRRFAAMAGRCGSTSPVGCALDPVHDRRSPGGSVFFDAVEGIGVLGIVAVRRFGPARRGRWPRWSPAAACCANELILGAARVTGKVTSSTPPREALTDEREATRRRAVRYSLIREAADESLTIARAAGSSARSPPDPGGPNDRRVRVQALAMRSGIPDTAPESLDAVGRGSRADLDDPRDRRRDPAARQSARSRTQLLKPDIQTARLRSGVRHRVCLVRGDAFGGS